MDRSRSEVASARTDRFISDIWAEPDVKDPLWIEKIASEQGIAVYQLAPFFRADWQRWDAAANQRKRYTIGDKLHPSPFGAMFGSQALADIISKQP